MTDIERYIEERAKMRVNGDEIHSLHVGTDREVHLRVSDIRAQAKHIEELEAALTSYKNDFCEFNKLERVKFAACLNTDNLCGGLDEVECSGCRAAKVLRKETP